MGKIKISKPRNANDATAPIPPLAAVDTVEEESVEVITRVPPRTTRSMVGGKYIPTSEIGAKSPGVVPRGKSVPNPSTE